MKPLFTLNFINEVELCLLENRCNYLRTGRDGTWQGGGEHALTCLGDLVAFCCDPEIYGPLVLMFEDGRAIECDDRRDRYLLSVIKEAQYQLKTTGLWFYSPSYDLHLAAGGIVNRPSYA